jgi:signal transduction histidine kinase
MEVHGYPILDSTGRVVQMIEYNLDVTERTNAKRTLQAMSQRATLYLDILSHDISNQLQAIFFSIEFLQNLNMSGEMAAHFKRLHGLIDESAQKCRKIISKVMITEKLMTVPLFERRLEVVLKECTDSLMKEHRDVMIDFEIEGTECWILADEFLEHVFMNLLENALIHNSSNIKRIWVHLSRKENEYEVSISDNGEGIPESFKHNLFDMSRRSGGIGLHQSNHILQKYSGDIEVHDRINGKPKLGTEILVRLPKKQRQV